MGHEDKDSESWDRVLRANRNGRWAGKGMDQRRKMEKAADGSGCRSIWNL
jgi:hypothetical protein